MALSVQLSLFDDGSFVPAAPQVERPAVSVEDFFFYDDYYRAAVRAGLVSEVSKRDWCHGCPVRMVCDRDMCSRGMKIDVNK